MTPKSIIALHYTFLVLFTTIPNASAVRKLQLGRDHSLQDLEVRCFPSSDFQSTASLVPLNAPTFISDRQLSIKIPVGVQHRPVPRRLQWPPPTPPNSRTTAAAAAAAARASDNHSDANLECSHDVKQSLGFNRLWGTRRHRFQQWF